MAAHAAAEAFLHLEVVVDRVGGQPMIAVDRASADLVDKAGTCGTDRRAGTRYETAEAVVSSEASAAQEEDTTEQMPDRPLFPGTHSDCLWRWQQLTKLRQPLTTGHWH